MKTIILTSMIGLATASMASAVTLDLSNPPASVTISGDVNTTSSPHYFGVDGLFINNGETVCIDFGTNSAGSFELIDVDNGGGYANEIASLSADGGHISTVAVGTTNIVNTTAAANPVKVEFSGTKICISNTGGGYGFAVRNVQYGYIPEPSTAILSSLGLIALFRRRR